MFLLVAIFLSKVQFRQNCAKWPQLLLQRELLNMEMGHRHDKCRDLEAVASFWGSGFLPSWAGDKEWTTFVTCWQMNNKIYSWHARISHERLNERLHKYQEIQCQQWKTRSAWKVRNQTNITCNLDRVLQVLFEKKMSKMYLSSYQPERVVF